MGRRVIDGPDRSRLLIDVPTRILINVRPQDITPAIGSVNSPTFTGTSPSLFIIIMSTTFTSIFNNDARAEGVRTLCAARGAGRHASILDNNQSRAARCASRRADRREFAREITPFDFNIGRYSVSPL